MMHPSAHLHHVEHNVEHMGRVGPSEVCALRPEGGLPHTYMPCGPGERQLHVRWRKVYVCPGPCDSISIPC
jgi:hypothetical protein